MVKLSTKARYGIRALAELARCTKAGAGPIKRKEIALKQQIDEDYLEQIVLLLKKGGIIDTKRGAKGGIYLTIDPESVNLLQVVELLEGPLAPVECTVRPEMCKKAALCTTRPVWVKMKKAMEEVLQSTTLHDIARNDQQNPDYII